MDLRHQSSAMCFIMLGEIIPQSELDRRHQSAFLKKRFYIHHVPPHPGRQTKKSNQHRKHERK